MRHFLFAAAKIWVKKRVGPLHITAPLSSSSGLCISLYCSYQFYPSCFMWPSTLRRTWYSRDGETEDWKREIVFQRCLKEIATQVSQFLFRGFSGMLSTLAQLEESFPGRDCPKEKCPVLAWPDPPQRLLGWATSFKLAGSLPSCQTTGPGRSLPISPFLVKLLG